MAKITGPFSINGKIGHLSVYNLRGVGQVARQPWGPSAHDIETKPSYSVTRRNTSEHGGCSRASKYLRRNFHPLEPVRDHCLSGAVTGWLKAFLELDTESEYGKRHILLSRHPRLLEGLNLSERHAFDASVRGGLAYELRRDTRTATIRVPELLPGMNFTPTGRQPYFRVVATLGAAPDLFWTPAGYSLAPAYEQLFPAVARGEWLPTAQGSEAFTLELQLPTAPPDEHFALVLTVGVLMGTAGKSGRLEAVRYAGCGRVLAAG